MRISTVRFSMHQSKTVQFEGGNMTPTKTDLEIIKQVKRYYVHFAKLGDYDSLEYWADSKKEAENLLSELQKKYPNYFGFVAKIINAVRESGKVET